ncbi:MULTISPECIES: RnfABCDGE type electron transport complex subunit D [Pseudomonas]|uniref:Ion-translocating oxidoreductase complex subunit D n=1 Tax=Pseudomonas chlororaphis subsp. aureofaciens TaxID=587851 RepID=A0AAD1E971_9PSED|nr:MULTISPECIES: RnfABCDGE type electron transport complex subunit D [Pseudomonas]AZE06958.1 Electron transport complex protein RnfD [Pseudomonas chlororaphis subsp. aureofaciens]AZE25452.1 Electron transport complex protein RnfD [Pseudomonas chlororaphis subsp. aureofaciens]AZE31744.1 Electron transport complex protein RnfD [Pseudomonas chlororaphis subsp. aureofaciens]AZE37985.1 Electron transport complex protein RnfD [Pseudomonas chlororaphis subsp. aureofaciens]AZE44370.1 Electron transpor
MTPLEQPDERLQQAMKRVLVATLPGLLALFWLFGWGILINLLLACATALAVEAAVLRLRQWPLRPFLGDGSALVSATLLALALPPYCPWWLTVSATACALLFGKHLYGGVGKNPFNPAMLGYALVLVSFPQQMTHWPASHGLDLLGGLQQVFGIASDSSAPDAWAQATALDSLRINKSLTIDELFAGNAAFGHFGGKGVEWVNLAFLAGGAFLLQQRVFSWHAPAGMLGSLFVISLLCWNGSGSDSHGSPFFHLLTGATMLGAFFIVTEPVSGPKSAKARLLFGVGVGLLTYLIRTWGGYPDGVAFAVLLMNLAVPALERLAAPPPEPSLP